VLLDDTFHYLGIMIERMCKKKFLFPVCACVCIGLVFQEVYGAVSLSLTSLSSTNMAISETKVYGAFVVHAGMVDVGTG